MYSRPGVILSGAKDLYIMLRIYFYQLNREDLTTNRERYLSLLPPWRAESCHRMKFERGKLQQLAAGMLLRHALQKEGMELMKVPVSKNEHGKPMIDGIYFNLSHSDDYITAAVADCPVGIDVETKTDPELKITRRFYSPEEQDAVRRAADPQKEFRRIWTRKEAYVKCVGTGLAGEICDIPSLPEMSGDYHLMTLRVEEGYALSIVFRRRKKSESEDIMLDTVTSFDI